MMSFLKEFSLIRNVKSAYVNLSIIRCNRRLSFIFVNSEFNLGTCVIH